MALSTSAEDLVKRYARRTTISLYRNSVFASLCDGSFTAEMVGARRVIIQNPSIPATVTTRTRGANWKTPTEVTSAQINLDLDQPYEVVQTLRYEDMRQSPDIGWLDRMNRAARLNSAINIDTNVASLFASQTYATADKISVGSGSTNAVTLASPDYFKGTGDELVLDSLRYLSTHWYRKNLIDGPTIGGTAGRIYAVMAPELFQVLTVALEGKDYHWDVLTADILATRILSNMMWKGRLFGIDILVSNALAVPASGSSWKFYSGTREAMALVIDEPVMSEFSPTTNPDGPNYKLNMAGLFGRVRVNTSFITEITLNTTDT